MTGGAHAPQEGEHTTKVSVGTAKCIDYINGYTITEWRCYLLSPSLQKRTSATNMCAGHYGNGGYMSAEANA